MAEAENLADWRGKQVTDRDGQKIGKLEDVYVDTETDEQLFGTVKEGLIGRHLTFLPLQGATATPDGLKVQVSKEQVKDAPNLDSDAELTQQDEAELFTHYGIQHVPPPTVSGRRLARR